MTTDEGLKGLTDAQWSDLLSKLNLAVKRFWDNGITVEMDWKKYRDSVIADAGQKWLSANRQPIDDSSAVHDSGDGEMWRKLNADCNEVPCSFPCLRDDLADWKAAVAVESGRAILAEKGRDE